MPKKIENINRKRARVLKDVYCGYDYRKPEERIEKPSDKWSRTEAIAIAKVLRHKASESERQVAHNAIGTLLRECKEFDCYTSVYEMLLEARKRFKTDADNDSDDSDFDDIFDADGTRVQYDTTNFTIEYTTTAGANDIVQDPNSDTAVNVTLQDGTVIGTTNSGNGVPDFVEMLGIWLEYYLQQYIAYGFNSPIQTDASGNPIKLQVVIEEGGSWTGPGSGIHIENILGSAAGLAGGYNTSTSGMGVTPGHELFHQVQYTYNNGAGLFLKIYKEGTARLAEDYVNDAYNRYNNEVLLYLNNTTVNHFSVNNKYRTVLFWKYLAEQLGTVTTEPQRGVDAIISLWQNLVGANSAADGINATNNTINALPNGVSIQDTFSKFAIANYLKDLGDPFIDSQYDYLEDEEPRVPGGQVYTSLIPLDSQILNGLSDDYTDSDTINSWGLHYYEFDIESSVQDLTIDLIADAAFTNPFFKILEIRGSDVTIHEGGGANYSEQIINDITDITVTPVDKIVVIVGAYADGGAYDITVSINEGVPSVVLVLDHSGSMSSQNKIQSARNAANLFVDVAEANGVPGLGAVGFSTQGMVLANSALEILNAAKANNIKGDINALSPTNMTSIGHGLQIGKNEFDGDPVDAASEVMVLLSDGKENTSPMIADVQTDIINAGLKVYTIGLGTDWAIEPQKLEDLATDTDADYIMTDNPALLQEFYLQILASILGGGMNGGNDSDETSDSDSDDANLFVGPFTEKNYKIGTKSKQVHVISSDRQLNVILTWREANIKNIGLVLVGPNNTKFTGQDAKDNNIIYKRGVNYAFFTIKLPCKGNHVGTWTAYAMLPVNTTVNYELKSMMTSG
ncbi:MAG: VWA domain-containing protein, partial [Gammaproteobacteria bacterium]|nr:VWA domain-containing protein [Gammaproteobacteria bacterium]